MSCFAPLVDVENLAGDVRGQHLRRVAGHLDDMCTLAIASMTVGTDIADIELRFDINEAHALALAALSGDRRALTTPGIARKLSATVAILFRVCLASGGLQHIGVDNDGGSLGGHRDETGEAGSVDD